MIESEAKKKTCHVSMGCLLTRYCEGSGCVAWDEWTEPVKDGGGRIVGHRALDEPSGECGLKPPELNCNGGF